MDTAACLPSLPMPDAIPSLSQSQAESGAPAPSRASRRAATLGQAASEPYGHWHSVLMVVGCTFSFRGQLPCWQQREGSGGPEEEGAPVLQSAQTLE